MTTETICLTEREVKILQVFIEAKILTNEEIKRELVHLLDKLEN